MPKSFTPEMLLSHLLTAIGIGSAAISTVTACGGSDNWPANSRPDASSADVNRDASPQGGSGGTGGAMPPGGGGNGGSITPISTDSSSGFDAAYFCGAFDWRPVRPDDPCAPDAAPSFRYSHVCFPAPDAGVACGDAYTKTCLLRGSAGCSDMILCGPFPGAADACCYILGPCLPPPPGRPFIVAGKARLAPASPDATWMASIRPDTAAIDDESRQVLADVWTE
jgi:hypothetical protein